MTVATLESSIARCRRLVEEGGLEAVREHKARTGEKAIGYFPVYSPVELYRAAGFLPVGLNGGGNRVEIAAADSRFGSFICSIVKSTMELGMRGDLKALDGLAFHSICDSARNLAFVMERNFGQELFVEYLHLPQNIDRPEAVDFLRAEYGALLARLAERNGGVDWRERLPESIALFNLNRALLRRLYLLREKRPQDLPTGELYVLMRAGNFLPVEEHNRVLEEALAELGRRANKPKDRIRVMLEGSFCEQPPLELLELLDDAGCYVVEDDLLLGRRWFTGDVRTDRDPLTALAEAYLKRPVASSVKHLPAAERMRALVDKARRSRAQAVLFLSAKFCEPALFDYVLFKEALEKAQLPHLLVEFEEKMWTFEKTRIELETLVESLLFD
ncbi:MAG: 2-hydroxyacyl-CoA dehydratase [Elusimicrobia bacterium]|nr:2-hydroxyacyl-CoA dehydratase [Elusimicrobiota bacterium]